MKIKSFTTAALALCLISLPLAAAAIDDVDCIAGLPCGGGAGGFIGTVRNIINVFLSVIAIIAVIVIIIAGFRLIVSGGDEETLRAARRQILYAVIGLVIILLSVIIVNFVISLFSESSNTNTTAETARDRARERQGN